MAGSEVYELDNILGSVTVGSKTLSFSGEAYGGVLEMQYRYPWKDHEGQLNCDVHFSIRFAPWIGKPVSQLPYLDKLLKCFDLGQNAATINLMLEIDGLQVLTAAGGALFKDQDSIDLFVLLRYLRNIRDILSVLNIGMIFTDGFKVSVDELQLTEETWQMLVELKKRRGNDLGDVTCVIEPTNNEEVANMSNGLASDKPMPYRLEQRLARHLNVFGKRIDCGLIRIDYSAMQMKLKNIEDVILIGRPVALKFVPAKDCVVNVEVIRDPPVVTHR